MVAQPPVACLLLGLVLGLPGCFAVSVQRRAVSNSSHSEAALESDITAVYEDPSQLVAYHAKHDAWHTRRWQTKTPSPWQLLAQDEDTEGRNLCIEGKQVPDFYVLGVQKCATSSLANDLMGAGVANVHGDKNPKEFHWFDHRMDLTSAAQEDEISVVNRESWLSWMPSCPGPTDGVVRRKALADFTPDYLRIVPRPLDFKFVGKWMQAQIADEAAPRYMRQMYAGQEHLLSFAVMFREPLAQMQSAWYHAASFNFTNACNSCRAPSFRVALHRALAGMRKSPPELSAWVWTTMYARQLSPWFEKFDASQFYMIPMHQLSGADKDQICVDISERLNFKAVCDSRGKESLHSWSHPHPDVDEDAGPELREAFDELMLPEKDRLVRLLTEASGMGLANFRGERGNYGDVSKWLDESW